MEIKFDLFFDRKVGCEGHIWTHQAPILKQIPSQARDGTLVEVLQIPVNSTVLRWRVKTDDSRLLRDRREIGSGDNGNNDDEEYDYDEEYDESYDDAEREDDEENESITEMPPRAYVPNASASKDTESENEHPHRHHHGEETIPWKVRHFTKDQIIGLYSSFAVRSSRFDEASQLIKKSLASISASFKLIKLNYMYDDLEAKNNVFLTRGKQQK